MKIIRYINAGNSSAIISTETAYFQTEVITNTEEDQQEKNNRVRLHHGLEFFVKRVNAANVIQRWWRKRCSQKRGKNVIAELLKVRA